MARSISSGLQSQIANDANKIAFLLEFNFSTPFRVTNFYRDVTYDSNSYQAGGEFVGVSTSPETGEVKVEQIEVTLANITSTIRNLIEAGNYTNVAANIYIAFFDSNETLVDATTYFSGFVSSASLLEKKDVSSVVLQITNHWANWKLKKGRHFTDESQQQIFSGDKGLEYADQTKDDIRWGND